MKISSLRNGLLVTLAAASLAAPCLAGPPGRETGFGQMTGSVLDSEGNPLMGATVLVIGPLLAEGQKAEASIERIVTDYQGKFKVERLLPGWYSLRVTAATRLPALRNGIRVEAGQTAHEKFVLADVFTPLRVQSPKTSSTSWGEDWKWILRSSSQTRPILRYAELAETSQKSLKLPLPASQRLIGMMPGSTRRQALAGDPGLGSVLAYLRPLSQDSDVLVAGSMGADGFSASSLATVFRKNFIKGDPQVLSLAVHQLSWMDGLALVGGDGRDISRRARIFVASYTNSRRLSGSLTLTTGLEVDYLEAAIDASTVRPHASLEYRLNKANLFVARYGAMGTGESESLFDRIGLLTAFPNLTLRGYRPQLETLNHTEAGYVHRFGKKSRLEVAAYRDSFYNAAVRGFGNPGALLASLAGSALPNAAPNGVTINAGSYRSSGARASFSQSLGSYVDTAFTYAVGDALDLASSGGVQITSSGNFRSLLRADRSRSFGGKICARVPLSHTQVTTSYLWSDRGRVTSVDPYGQASFELQPYLDVQIRQPLPTLAFLPARVEALADFRNLLRQGYVPINQSGEQLLLTPAYRSFRGGFSVQF